MASLKHQVDESSSVLSVGSVGGSALPSAWCLSLQAAFIDLFQEYTSTIRSWAHSDQRENLGSTLLPTDTTAQLPPFHLFPLLLLEGAVNTVSSSAGRGDLLCDLGCRTPSLSSGVDRPRVIHHLSL